MADRLRDMGAVSSRPIETASLVSDASPECDERPFISAVEQQRGRPGHYMLMDRLEGSDSKRAELIASLYANRLMTQLRRFASRGGARVLMTGNPGDAVMVNAPTDVGSIVEALDEGRWPRALGHAHEWCRSCRMTVWELTARVGRHYSRRADIRSAMRERLRSANVTTGRRLHENVEEAFHFTAATARLWINDAERGAERAHAHGRRGKRFLVRALVSLIETRDFESPLEYLPVLYTHPYMHRPLVEYMLAIPAEVTCSPGQPRALMRRAFGGLLPPRITARFSKGGTDPLTIRTLRARLEALGPVDRMLTVQSGYIDAAQLKATCSGIRSGSCVNLRNTERIVRLELWLRERVQTEDAQRKEVEPCTAVQN